MELNLKERRKLTAITAKKYRTAKKREKTKILDTFTQQTGYDRKYAIHILANEGTVKPAGKRVRLKITHKITRKRVYPVYYDKAVQEALALIWEAFNCQCGKLLASFLRSNIDSIKTESKFDFNADVIAKLRKISPSTIDRLLKPVKAKQKIKGTSGTKNAAKHIKALIPTLSRFECSEHGS